jgi:phthiocerol/phenolphthiocerol synthesis type-I polyketide synthase E
MTTAPESIAVVGMACRFPGAGSVAEFWRNLRAGVESITFFSEEELLAAGVDAAQLRDPRTVAAKGVLAEADAFDAGFFGISPREAALIDPQQRVFLETAWTALEDAGYDSRNYEGAIGVFAGSILSTYLLKNIWMNRDVMAGAGNFQVAVGNDPTFLATSTSYQLDLRGPSISVGTACSTSLVAVHLACQSLLSYESDMALAGGVSVHLPLVGAYRYEDGGILSPDGHCRPFDAAAQGTVSSDGVGVVLLKRYADAVADGDVIHALIRGSAINNDGRAKVGYTAPSGRGEARVIAEALAMAGVSPESLSLVEAHGAGTLLGDPIEVTALVDAFGDCGGKRAFCALGSVKSNIGHVDAASGIAGFIKAVLTLRHRELPPTLHFERANPQIDFEATPFYVNRELEALTGDEPIRAGVSSFGIGGTNVHMVLEEAPVGARAAPHPSPLAGSFRRGERGPGVELLLLSARTATALETATENLAAHLEQSDDALADVAYTLRRGRRPFTHRRVVVSSDRSEAAAMLRDPKQRVSGVAASARPSIAFLFPGLGDHYAGMGWELYCTEEVFRAEIDHCAELLRGRLDGDIRDHLYPNRDWRNPRLESVPAANKPALDLRAMLGKAKAGEAPADAPAAAQPAIFVTEIALAALLRSWGIEPEAMIGHSIGEFSAAYVSGVLSLPDALEVVATRARLIQSRVAHGAMLAVPLSEDELLPLLPGGVSLGAINAFRLCIASGEIAAIDELVAMLTARGISAARLRSTHAYHSAMMESIVEPLADVLRRVTLHAPRIPYVSCITGTWITDGEATDPQYWARHLCRTVRFQSGLSTLLDDPQRVLLEVGPGQGLTSHAIAERARVAGRTNEIVPAMRWSYGLQSERAVLLRAVGQLWSLGAPLDTGRFGAHDAQKRVQLPTYPFERQRYWIDPPTSTGVTVSAPQKKADVADWFYLPSWKPSVLGSASREEVSGKWLLFADRLGVGARLAEELRARGANVAVVESGSSEDYEALIREWQPRRIVHLWSLIQDTCDFSELQQLGYDSLVRIVRSLSGEESVRIDVVANGLHDVPGMATLRGPMMVAPQEHPGLICRTIDLAPEDAHVLLDELHGDAIDPDVRYRDGMRWLPAYEPVRLGDLDSERIPFRHRGVYLITGGLGGVGLVLARHLAERAQARLVLVGRSAQRVPAVDALEALGAEVLVLRADVANRDDMRRVLHETEERFGTLHGVIHAAGAVGIETFREVRQTGPAATETQFLAKVRGTMVLDELLADRPLDFCLLLSSLSAILGGLGFAAYSAANLFLDAFARSKNATQIASKRNGTRWVSVDWDSWRLADKRPAIAGLGATVNEFVMEPHEGADACERILAARALAHVVVSTGDLQARLRTWIERRQDAQAPPAAARHARPALRTDYEAPRGELETGLAEIWQELFGVASVGVNDNFFELGGHSLLATQLNARLASRLHVEMSLAALLQAPTIAELADPDALERLLAELEELVDE